MPRAPDAKVVVEETSQPYVGRWNRLVSTTNWEKGRIIHEWRAAVQASGSPSTEYSDEAWSRLVGGVTGQHAGRLRRVYERFGDVFQEYEGLYWSHFQAALDWPDAEMWLEGALQNDWSVSRMRRQRWQTLGAVPGEEPHDRDLLDAKLDRDGTSAAAAGSSAPEDRSRVLQDGECLVEARSPAGPDFGDADEVPARPRDGESPLPGVETEPRPSLTLLRPFENLPQLPADLAESFESFQLAILRHKAGGWQEVSREEVLSSLDALKTLVLAPSAAEA
jgi:hypothetical protein